MANPTAAPVLSLLPLARHLGYGFLPVPRVYLATIAVAAGYPPGGCPDPSRRGVQPIRRRDPPLELLERTEQLLASRDWLPR